MLVRITNSLLTELSGKASLLPRKRINHNFHKESSDTLQRMLNAMEPETYVQPHKHEEPDKREVFLILKGKAVVITFNEQGDISDWILLNRKTNFAVEIPGKTWHTIISLERGTVVYEVKDGPYEPTDDKNFAAWAPSEKEPGCMEYNRKLLKQIGLA